MIEAITKRMAEPGVFTSADATKLIEMAQEAAKLSVVARYNGLKSDAVLLAGIFFQLKHMGLKISEQIVLYEEATHKD